MQVTAVSQVAAPVVAAIKPTVAVVPAAGFGTRLRPLTNSLPKEMLPVGRQTALERIVDELDAAGLRRVVFVLSPAKEALIRARFGDGDPATGMEFAYVLQREMRGLGDAVLRAEPYVGDSAAPFLVALGDAVFEEAMIGGLTGRLIADAVGAGAGVGVLVRRVERSLLARYGVVRPAQTGGALGDGAFAITDIVEKPAPDDAPSDFAASARYLVTTEVFAALRETPPGRNGEIEFTDAMRRLLAGGVGGCATPLRTGERRHDLGNLTAYFEAFVAFALADPECGDAVRRSLERHVRDRSDAQLEMPTRKEVIAE